MNKNLLMLVALAARGNSQLKSSVTKKKEHRLSKVSCQGILDNRDSCNVAEIATETFAASNADTYHVETGCTISNIVNNNENYHVNVTSDQCRRTQQLVRVYTR